MWGQRWVAKKASHWAACSVSWSAGKREYNWAGQMAAAKGSTTALQWGAQMAACWARRLAVPKAARWAGCSGATWVGSMGPMLVALLVSTTAVLKALNLAEWKAHLRAVHSVERWGKCLDD